MSTIRPIGVRHGDNAPPIIWNFDFDLTGSDFLLEIVSRAATILALLASDDALVIDPAAKTVTWTPTVAQSRLIMLGNLSTYRLQRQIEGGEFRTYYNGHVVGVPETGDDPTAEFCATVTVSGPQGPKGDTGPVTPEQSIVNAIIFG